VFSSSTYDHITPRLQQRHWLRAPERIQFKLAVLVYKCLHGTAPSYLADELEYTADFWTRRRLRFSSSLMLNARHNTAVHHCCCPLLEQSDQTCHVRNFHVHFPKSPQGFLQRTSITCYAECCTSCSKSVHPSVCHMLALCQYHSYYDQGVFTGR